MSGQAPDHDLATRIAALEDRQAIEDLVHAHAQHARYATFHLALDLFMPDAVFELHHSTPAAPQETTLIDRVVGAAAITASKNDIAGPSASIWPMIHNLRITLDGDSATGTCVAMATIWPHGYNPVGEYRDTYCRHLGRWRFAERRYVLFGNTDGTYALDAHAEYLAVRN